jgi:hypothetical protein
MTASTNDALNKIQAAYRSAISQSENLIPAVREKNHQKMGQRLTDVQIESAIGPLLDYFDDNLQVLNGSLSATNLRAVLLRLWKEILLAVEDMIVPPLSDRPSTMRPLTDGELDVVLKWLKVSTRADVIVTFHSYVTAACSSYGTISTHLGIAAAYLWRNCRRRLIKSCCE